MSGVGDEVCSEHAGCAPYGGLYLIYLYCTCNLALSKVWWVNIERVGAGHYSRMWPARQRCILSDSVVGSRRSYGVIRASSTHVYSPTGGLWWQVDEARCYSCITYNYSPTLLHVTPSCWDDVASSEAEVMSVI